MFVFLVKKKIYLCLKLYYVNQKITELAKFMVIFKQNLLSAQKLQKNYKRKV